MGDGHEKSKAEGQDPWEGAQTGVSSNQGRRKKSRKAGNPNFVRVAGVFWFAVEHSITAERPGIVG